MNNAYGWGLAAISIVLVSWFFYLRRSIATGRVPSLAYASV